MNSFTLLFEHEDDAILIERLLMENNIFYDYDVIGDDHLIYEFTMHMKDRKIVNLLLVYNDIKNIDFKSS